MNLHTQRQRLGAQIKKLREKKKLSVYMLAQRAGTKNHRMEQSQNRRVNRRLTFKGETKSVKEWSAFLNINYSTIIRRLNLGWNEQETLGTVLMKNQFV